MGITNNTHSHLAAVNPLGYKVHEKALERYYQAIAIAQTHRETFLSFSESQRILDRLGYRIDRHTYYNIRQKPMKLLSSQGELFHGLIAALKDAGFLYTLRFEDEFDSEGKVIAQRLEQAFFLYIEELKFAQRFVADHALLVDGTFSTNRLNLVLINLVSVNNCDLTVPVGHSFARSESKISFDFIFRSIDELIFNSPRYSYSVPWPRVAISDQAAGFIASAPRSLPNTLVQFCDWHVAQNIKKKLAEKRYTKAEREEIMAATWAFIKSSTHPELADNRTKLYSLLKSGEVSYIEKTWVPRERQFLRIYTSKYANLGCFSNQRSEGLHP